MNKIKTYLLIFAVLFCGSSVVLNNIQSKKIIQLETENSRVQSNNAQLMGDNLQKTTLVLRKNEINKELSKKIDSLAEALKIRPKEIIKIVTETITEIDSIPYPVIVDNVGQNFWKLKDSGDCFIWQADAFLKDDSLNINRTLFDYHNEVTNTFYKERPHKFLFIKYGKWVYKQKIDAQCGGVKVKEIQFIK